MYIYLIKSDDGRHKIGKSKNPDQRLKNLQTGNSEKLTVLYKVFVNSQLAIKIEIAIHEKFRLVRKKGEWFTLSLEDELIFESSVKTIEQNLTFLLENGNQFI